MKNYICKFRKITKYYKKAHFVINYNHKYTRYFFRFTINLFLVKFKFSCFRKLIKNLLAIDDNKRQFARKKKRKNRLEETKTIFWLKNVKVKNCQNLPFCTWVCRCNLPPRHRRKIHLVHRREAGCRYSSTSSAYPDPTYPRAIAAAALRSLPSGRVQDPDFVIPACAICRLSNEYE